MYMFILKIWVCLSSIAQWNVYFVYIYFLSFYPMCTMYLYLWTYFDSNVFSFNVPYVPYAMSFEWINELELCYKIENKVYITITKYSADLKCTLRKNIHETKLLALYFILVKVIIRNYNSSSKWVLLIFRCQKRKRKKKMKHVSDFFKKWKSIIFDQIWILMHSNSRIIISLHQFSKSAFQWTSTFPKNP